MKNACEAKLQAELRDKPGFTSPPVIQRDHRFGKSRDGQPRRVIAAFYSSKEKDKVLVAAWTCKPKGFYVQEDYCNSTQNIRDKLKQTMLKAGLRAFLKVDKLCVDYSYRKRNLYTLI